MEISLKDRAIEEFEALSNLNPDFFRVQRVTGQFTPVNASFTAFRPSPDNVLYSTVYIRWVYTLTKNYTPNGGVEAVENFTEADKIYTKPFAMTNAMDAITVRYNGHSTTYTNPKIWGKYVHATESTTDLLSTKFASAGSRFPENNGFYNLDGTALDGGDPGVRFALGEAYDNYKNGLNPPVAFSSATISFTEPLMVGLHNPYELKHKLKPKSRYRRLSWMIPHINRFGVDVKFSNLAANNFVFLFADHTDNSQGISRYSISRTDVAEMMVTWINPSAGYKIPKSIFLPSWYVEHFQFPVSGGNQLPDRTVVDVNTQEIVIHQIPSSILIFASNSKVEPNFGPFALSTQQDDGTNQSGTLIGGCQELNMSFREVDIRVNINNVTIDNTLTRQELYRLTEKNCNEIPFSFVGWDGGAQNLGSSPSEHFLYLLPEDLNIKPSTGIKQLNFFFQVIASMETKEGYRFSKPGVFPVAAPTHQYNLHVVYFFDNYYFQLQKDGFVTSGYLTNTL